MTLLVMRLNQYEDVMRKLWRVVYQVNKGDKVVQLDYYSMDQALISKQQVISHYMGTDLYMRPRIIYLGNELKAASLC